jgi:hypothetical protein
MYVLHAGTLSLDNMHPSTCQPQHLELNIEHNTNKHQLGIPTANIPPDGLAAYPSLAEGVYYGVVTLDPAQFVYNKDESTGQPVSSANAAAAAASFQKATILPAVLSIGYNPFYKNEVKSIVRLSFVFSTCLYFLFKEGKARTDIYITGNPYHAPALCTQPDIHLRLKQQCPCQWQQRRQR